MATSQFCPSALTFAIPICLLFLAFLFPGAAHAQQQMQIIAGYATPQGISYAPAPPDGSIEIIGGPCTTVGLQIQNTSPVQLCNAGYSGDGGQATQAEMNYPMAVAVDAAGNVYIADAGNAVVRKIDTSGNMSTYAWVDASGNVTTSGPPANPGFYPAAYPSALAVDGQGNVHVGVTTSGGVETLAMATDSNGNVYSLQEQLGAEYTIVGPNGSINLPFDQNVQGLAVDSMGNIYTIGTTGSYAGEILKFDSMGNMTVVATRTQIPGLEGTPAGNGLAIDSKGNLYVITYGTSYGGNLIQEFNPTTGVLTNVAGTGTTGFNNGNIPNGPYNIGEDYTPYVDQPMPATQTDINNANGILIGPDGTLYIADTYNNIVRRVFSPAGTGCMECGPTGLAITDTITRPLPQAWAMNPTLHKLYLISSSNPGFVTVFNTSNDTVLANIQVGNSPGALAVDSVNNFVYVADTVANVVYVINSTTDQLVGSPVPVAGQPMGIALDTGLNKAYVSIFDGGYTGYPAAVSVIAGPSGGNPASHLTDLGAYGSAYDLTGPSAIVADSFRHLVYVRYLGSSEILGYENYSLAVIDSTMDQVTTTASLGLAESTNIYPDSMAIDETSGNVLIGDDFDRFAHLWIYSSQALGGAFEGYGGFFSFHVAADSVNEIFYTWDGYGNSGYLVPNETSGTITSTSVYGNPNVSYVAVDQSSDQAYVVNCISPNNDGTLGTVTLWDGDMDTVTATLPLEIPSTVANLVCGGLLVDTSNSNAMLHSAWVDFSYYNNANGQTASQIDVINGQTPGARPQVTFLLGSLLHNPAPFQSVGVGQTSAEWQVQVKNVGQGPLTSVTPLIQDSQDPGSLQIVPDSNGCAGVSSTQPLANGESCSLELTFTPSQVESFSGSVTFIDNAPDTPQSLPVSGSGVPAVSALTITPQYLPPGVVGQSYGQLFSTSGLVGTPTYTLTGTLPPDLVFEPALGWLTTTSGNPTLQPQDVGTWTFTISVTDSGSLNTGSQFYALTITSTAAGQTTASLFGSGNSGTISFGSIEVNEPSPTLQTQVEDTGFSVVYANLQITSINLVGPNAGDFTESDNCVGQSVQEYSSCTISVTFTPTAAPTANEVAELILGANAPLAPIYLLGTSAPDLGAPASLPVAASVDNGNPPNLASAGNACNPYCGGGITTTGIGAISGGGRYVAFSFPATNLPGPQPQSSGTSGAYLRTTCVGSSSGCVESTQYISYGPTTGPASNSGAPCNTSSGSGGGSSASGIDDTNQFVLFQSNACNFTGSTYQNAGQIFLRDVINKVTSLISLDYTGTQVLNNGASGSSMSATAQQYAFQSASTNVVSGFTNPNGNSEVYWRNNQTTTNVLVSQDNASDGFNDRSQDPAISASGRYVAYDSYATMIASAPTNNNTTGLAQVYLYDTCNNPPQGQQCTPGTKLISVDGNGNAAGGTNPSVSSDGRFVVFLSSAPTLISPANPPQFAEAQVYLYDTCTSNGTPVPNCTAQAPILLSQVAGTSADENSSGASISADGLLITFNSNSAVLNPSGNYQGAVYKYTNCLASNAPSPCPTGLINISVDANGNPLPSVNGGSLVDSTDQFFIFGEEPGGYGSPTEVYLGPASPGGPMASFSVVFSWADILNAGGPLDTTSISFGPPFPIGEPEVAANCNSYFAIGCAAVYQNESLVSLMNTGTAPLPLDAITITNTATGQLAPFVPQQTTCQGSMFTPGQATALSLPPSGTCEFAVFFEPTTPGTYNGVITATGVPGNSIPMTGAVTGPSVNINAPGESASVLNLSYTVVVSNPTASAVSNLTLTIPVPAGTTLVGVTPQTFNCNRAIVCGGSLPAGGNENIVVTVTPPSSGTVTETASLNLTATYPGANVPAQTASATTTIATLVSPTVSLSFSPASITVSPGNYFTGETATEQTTLNLAIANPNPFALTGATLSLTLPQGLAFDESSIVAGGSGLCGAGGSFTVTANTLSLTGGTLPPSGTCTISGGAFSLLIDGLAVGNYTVTTGPVTFTGGTGGAGSGTLTVTPILAPTVSIAFTPSTVQPGGQTTLTFAITNPNQLSNLTGVSLVDILPPGLVFTSSAPASAGCIFQLSPVAVDGQLMSLSGAAIPSAVSEPVPCSFSFTATALVAGSYTDTTQAVTFDQGAGQGTGGTASASLTVAAPPANTAVGEDVSVMPVDSASGTSPVTVTFSDVTSPGTTTLAITSTGPPPPAGYAIGTNGLNNAVYFNLATTAIYSGNVTLCFNYSDLNINPQYLTLFHYVDDQPPGTQIYPGPGGTINTTTDMVCGVVTSLSPFILAQANPYAALTPGVISTLQSSSAAGSILSAVAFDQQNNEYVLDSGLGTVTEYPVGGGNSNVIVATGTLLNPSDLAFGPDGTLYISDQGSARIVSVTFSNSSVQAVTPLTISGNGAPTLEMPTGIAVGGPNGDLFVSDPMNGAVYEFGTSGVVSSGTLNYVATVINTSSYSGLNEPLGVAVDPAGDVYIANSPVQDPCNPQPGAILEVTAGSTEPASMPTVIASPQIVAPYGLALDPANDLYYTDASLFIGGRINVATGNVIVIAGTSGTSMDSGDGGPATQAGIASPLGIALDAYNRIYIADSNVTAAMGGSIRLVDVTTSTVNFSSQQVGTSSSVQTVLLTDPASGTLNVSNVAISGANAPEFSLTGSTCAVPSFMLASGASCQLAITFSPLESGGTHTANITLQSGTNTQTIQLSGMASAPAMPITPTVNWAAPAAIIYGTALGGTQLDATVTPNVPGMFVYTPPAGTVLNVGAAQNLAVVFTPMDTTDYVSADGGAQITVNTAPLTIAANNASRAYGTANPTLTPTVTGAVNGDTFTETLATTATTTSAVGAYPITVSNVMGADLANYTLTTSNGTLTVTQAGTSVQLSTSANGSVANGTPVVLTATVVPATSGTPTGTVTFLNGSASLGTGALSQGVATLTISTLPTGSNNITAQYGGDTNFTASTSRVETVAVNSPDYTVSANPSSLTLAAGQSGSTTITVTPEAYSGTVTFSCGSLPSYVTCAFNPSSGAVTLSGGTTPQTLTLTVSVASTIAMVERRGPMTLAMIMPFGLLTLLPMIGRHRRRLRRYVLLAGVTLVLGGALAGCGSSTSGSGSGSSSTLPPAGTQSFTVTASGSSSSGTDTHQLQLTITITN